MIRILPLLAGGLLLAACEQRPTETAPEVPPPTAIDPAPEPEPVPEAMPEEAPAEPPAAEAEPAPALTPAAASEDFSQFTGNAAAGKAVFAQCQACHVLTEGQNRVGPSLHNIVGREAGTVPGFRYSPANQNSAVVWTEENLFEYLRNPRQFIPGTTMAFAGIRDPQRRADLIAFLKANGEV